MRCLLVYVVLLLVAGCSSEDPVPADAAPPPAESERASYPSESVGKAPCGLLQWPVSDGDGGLAWEPRYVPCGGGLRNPVSDPPMDDQDPGPIPDDLDPRPDPPGDPTPW